MNTAMTSWKEYLLRQARLESMCTENMDALRACETKADAIALYKKTIDWALEKNYPTVNFIRNEFGDCENLGVYIDRTFNGELLNEHQCYVFHNCRGHITVDINIEKRIIPMLYFANGCNISVSCESQIKVPLYIFGENNIDADDTFRIYRKGGAK